MPALSSNLTVAALSLEIRAAGLAGVTSHPQLVRKLWARHVKSGRLISGRQVYLD